MNEQIQLLAEQATLKWGEEVPGGVQEMEFFDKEKFAELIVKECAQAFEAEVDTWKAMDPYQGSIKRQGTKAIKQHFGVTE